MAKVITISGLPNVLANLKKSKLLTATGMQRGLKQAGSFLQRESQKIVPVDE